MKAILMKAILTTMTVLGLCVSLSGLRVPGSGVAGKSASEWVRAGASGPLGARLLER
jgi:hypothetical protein